LRARKYGERTTTITTTTTRRRRRRRREQHYFFCVAAATKDVGSFYDSKYWLGAERSSPDISFLFSINSFFFPPFFSLV
jgi:hypothetical protein